MGKQDKKIAFVENEVVPLIRARYSPQEQEILYLGDSQERCYHKGCNNSEDTSHLCYFFHGANAAADRIIDGSDFRLTLPYSGKKWVTVEAEPYPSAKDRGKFADEDRGFSVVFYDFDYLEHQFQKERQSLSDAFTLSVLEVQHTEEFTRSVSPFPTGQ